MVDFHNRVNPAIVQVREGRRIGRNRASDFTAMRASAITVLVSFENAEWASRSSALWFLGSHVVDVLRFVLADEMTRVFSVSRSGRTLRPRGRNARCFISPRSSSPRCSNFNGETAGFWRPTIR